MYCFSSGGEIVAWCGDCQLDPLRAKLSDVLLFILSFAQLHWCLCSPSTTTSIVKSMERAFFAPLYSRISCCESPPQTLHLLAAVAAWVSIQKVSALWLEISVWRTS